MSFAYLPLYTGDYLRDTQHLSCSEHGIYLKFLMHCWDQKGPIPLDERKQQGICNARSGDEIEAMRRIRTEFFVQMDDGFYNMRMQREVEKAENISGARSEAGRKGYLAKAKQLPSKSQASASIPTPSPILPPAQSSKDKPLAQNADAFARVWAAYPKKKGKAAAMKAFAKLKPTPEFVLSMLGAIEEAKSSEDWRREDGRYIPYPASWLNGRRWEDEVVLPIKEQQKQLVCVICGEPSGHWWLSKRYCDLHIREAKLHVKTTG